MSHIIADDPHAASVPQIATIGCRCFRLVRVPLHESTFARMHDTHARTQLCSIVTALCTVHARPHFHQPSAITTVGFTKKPSSTSCLTCSPFFIFMLLFLAIGCTCSSSSAAVQSTSTTPCSERVHFKDRVTRKLIKKVPPSCFVSRSAASAMAQEDAMSPAQDFAPT